MDPLDERSIDLHDVVYRVDQAVATQHFLPWQLIGSLPQGLRVHRLETSRRS